MAAASLFSGLWQLFPKILVNRSHFSKEDTANMLFHCDVFPNDREQVV